MDEENERQPHGYLNSKSDLKLHEIGEEKKNHGLTYFSAI